MEIGMTKVVNVNAKTLSIYLKVRDEFSANLLDEDGSVLGEYEGYVPSFMPGQHNHHYVYLNIDIDTGQITNWKVPTQKQIEEFLEECI